jgi:hypothetical protein
MRNQMKCSQSVILVVLLASAAALLASGCEETCTSSERSYRRALAAERTSLVDQEDLSGDSPAQFGLALKTEFIGDIADFVIQPVIDAALTVGSSVQIDGRRVDLRTEGQAVDLDVSSDSACDHCFRVSAGLGGTLVADIPNWGQERANLGGSLAIVAPLLLERGESSDAALKLDLPAFVDVGRSSLSARLGGISDDAADLLEGPVTDFFFEILQRKLRPVTLVEFDAPSFGIPGFEVLPVQLVTDDAAGAVFAGFATNIEALNVPGALGVAPITDLGADESLALAFNPAIISHSLSLLMNDGQVARTYDLSGNADQRGDSHVTLDGFRVGHDLLDSPDDRYDAGYDASFEADAANMSVDAGTSTPGRQDSPDIPFALGFDVFNLSSREGFCFGFGAEAVGGVSVRDNALSVDLIDVRFTNQTLQENLVDLTQWMDADFVLQSRTLVNQSLDKATVTVPGTNLSVGAVGLELRENAVVLRAKSTATAAE